MSLALARKYRPKSFDDLIGQESVAQTLAHALDTKRLSHAYLFSGLRGSGKTSTARIFAKALLCEKGESSRPCGECTHCVMAAENRHMDIIEMDAASNRGIEDIKELIEHTKYKPASARYKIFIIDEVHMLTTQAFNALLKTLEEPPSFVKFILATTDPLKLPATILSRTQHFRFKTIPQPLVQSHLEHILHLEGIGFEKEAIEIIARSGAGSLRDSLTLLDQAIVYANGFIDVRTVTEMLGIIDPAKLEALMRRILERDEAGVLDFLKEASDYEAEMILDELTLYLKTLLLERKGILSPLIIERFFRIVADAKSLLATGSDGQFVLSLTLFKMLEAQQLTEIDAMIKKLESRIGGELASLASPSLPETPREVITITQEEIETFGETSDASTAHDATAAPSLPRETSPDTPPPQPQNEKPTASNPSASTPPSDPQAPWRAKFAALIERIYDRDYDLGTIFEEHITFVSFQEGVLQWESTVEGEEKKALINAWGVIKMLVEEIFGVGTRIDNIAKKKAPASSDNSVNSQTPPPHPTPQAASAATHKDADSASMLEEATVKSSCIAPEAGDTEAAKEKDPSELLEEPMVKTALELLNPKKVRIKRNV